MDVMEMMEHVNYVLSDEDENQSVERLQEYRRIRAGSYMSMYANETIMVTLTKFFSNIESAEDVEEYTVLKEEIG